MLNMGRESSCCEWWKPNLNWFKFNTCTQVWFQQSLGIEYILRLDPSSLMRQLATCMPAVALCSVFLCVGFTLRKLCSQEARWPQPPWKDLHQTKTGQEFQKKPQNEFYSLSQPLGNEICQLLFLDHLPISGGGMDSGSSEPHGPEWEKSSFLEEDLILLIVTLKWCWKAKYYI